MAGRYRTRSNGDEPIVPLSLRLPLSLWEKLKEDADLNKRGLNGEILFLCEQGLKGKNEPT